MESKSLLAYAKENGLTGQTHPKVKRSAGNGLFITFMTNKKAADGKAVVENIWVARTIIDAGRVSEGQDVRELDLGSMIIVETENAEGQSRIKLTYPGESNYVQSFEL